jgi:uncharacterized protein YdhG (YjbR/CyaY superfamily)
MKKTFKDVDEYIKLAPKWSQAALKEIRNAIKSAAPKATESISYNMPYYNQNGRLAYFAAAKAHSGFYWLSADIKKLFAKELSKQTVVGSTLRIPQDTKVPVTLIKKIVKYRVKLNEFKKKK